MMPNYYHPFLQQFTPIPKNVKQSDEKNHIIIFFKSKYGENTLWNLKLIHPLHKIETLIKHCLNAMC